MRPAEEIHLHGWAISPGVAIGSAFYLETENIQRSGKPDVPVKSVEDEIDRFRLALFSSQQDLETLHEALEQEGGGEAAAIIDTHIQMLKDEAITTVVEEGIRKLRQSTESVFQAVVSDYQEKLSKRGNYFQQRCIDVRDLSQRVYGHLSAAPINPYKKAPPGAVVFAYELTPTLAASAKASGVKAFVTASEGMQSHTALIARAKNIPYVSSIELRSLAGVDVKEVIVDGDSGVVIINPLPQTIAKYEKAQRLALESKSITEELSPCKMGDGEEIRIVSNVGNITDIELSTQYGAADIGLFRTEFLYFENPKILTSEKEQCFVYRKALSAASGETIVFRAFDLGGDKAPEILPYLKREINPVMGCRGIRFLLKNPSIFKIQIRAILRASLDGDARLLLPMVSDLQEVLDTKDLIEECTHELRREGVMLSKRLMVGCMIEVPAATLILDLLAQECDFFSIGTNDLLQYTLAYDRRSHEMSDFFVSAQPSFIRLMHSILRQTRELGLPTMVCGEIASSPLYIPLLIGMGARAFSCIPRAIPLIKKVIANKTIAQVEALAAEVYRMRTAGEVSELLFNHLPRESLTRDEVERLVLQDTK